MRLVTFRGFKEPWEVYANTHVIWDKVGAVGTTTNTSYYGQRVSGDFCFVKGR